MERFVRSAQSSLFAVVGAVFLLVVSACGASTESETKNWKKDQEAVVQQIELLPAFKPHLETRLEEAKTAWTEAEKVSAEKDKIEALAAARGKLDPLLHDLVEIEDGLNELNNTLTSLRELRLSGADDAKRNDSVAEATNAYTNANKKRYDARPSDDTSAVNTAAEVRKDVKAAVSDAQRVLKSLKKGAAKKKKGKTKS